MTRFEGHTKAPWEWWTSCSFKRLTGPDGNDGSVLHAYVCQDGVPDLTVSEADRELIAAAPDLLAAGEKLAEALEHRHHHPPHPSICEACAALAEWRKVAK